jgi:hypothetical protein
MDRFDAMNVFVRVVEAGSRDALATDVRDRHAGESPKRRRAQKCGNAFC